MSKKMKTGCRILGNYESVLLSKILFYLKKFRFILKLRFFCLLNVNVKMSQKVHKYIEKKIEYGRLL